MFKVNNFDKLLDKATSNLRLDPDWPTILQICDLIRQNDTSPKYAVAAIKKKLFSQNPHQAMFALLTLESIVKNCGSGVHEEVASKVFCEMLRDLVKTTQHENLRNKILELIQAWAFAFRNSPKYRAVQDTVNILKAEGFKFPTLWESDAMFSADTAPEWADGEVCHRCRVAFSLMVRRHHCRACGQVFCQQCSSKTSTLPKFGIEKEVRVCDACFDKVSRPPTSTAKLEIVDTASDYGPTQPQKRTGGKTAEELQEEEELQLALALSQSEAEHKEKERKTRHHIAPEPTANHPTASPTPSSVSASPEHAAQASSELSRYLDRNYWEQRVTRDAANAPAASAPAPAPASHDANEDLAKSTPGKAQDDDAEDKEIDEFVETLKSQVEIFVNRMKSNSSRGRSIANDTAVQTLFMNITAMHSQLLRYIQQQDDKRVYLESLQDKVSQIRDSRAALDTLRAEHAARLAAAAEAAERQRQMQMAAKLQAMRKKKHEYLQYQRQLALQRVQEQEREMQMRQEQQKHQYMMSANSGYFMPSMSMPQFQTGYPSQQIYGNTQYHPQMLPQATTDGTLQIAGQPQMSQANMQVGVNPMSTIAQSMPQLTNTFAAMSTTAAVTQNPGVQPVMNQATIRPGMASQLPLHQQMMMQQMHQMRMPVQPGVHQMMSQNVANNLPGQNMPQQNGQVQLQKQNLPNQPQQIPHSMNLGQQNMTQMLMNPSNPMAGIQMQNMRMPLMQSNQPGMNQQGPVPGYLNPQNNNNQQPGMQTQNTQQQPQIQMPGQQIPVQSQPMMQPGQNQGMPMSNHIPNQNAPPPGTQVPQNQGQPITQQPQMPQMSHGQPMMMQGSQMPSQVQNIPQQGQIGNQGQPMPQSYHLQQQQGVIGGHQMQPNVMPQQMPPQQAPQMQAQLPQQMNVPNQQIQQSLPQQMKMQQPNFGNAMQGQQQPQQQPQQLPPIQSTQPDHTPDKSEHNNNTAELISFD